MSSLFKAHRVAALIVLIGAGAWIATGEFASVGSDASAKSETAAQAAEAPVAKPAAEVAPLIRTVGGMVPEFADHARRINLSGTTQPDKRAVLAARSDGVVNLLALTKGDAITEGAVVMTLEGPEILARARISEIALEQREREFGVAQRLFSGGNTPEIELTGARSARDAAEAELTLARAIVDKLELESPFSGLVDSVDVELGEWVQTGAPIATILSLDPILVHAEVSELDIGHVVTGGKALIRLVNGTEMEGTVRFVAREASAETRTFPVEIALPNPDAIIPAGMTTEVELFAESVRAITVPKSVITLSTDGQIGLRVAGADNIARFVTIDIVDDTDEGLVVTGVPEDVRIIVAGQDLVRDGDTVVIAVAAKALPKASE